MRRFIIICVFLIGVIPTLTRSGISFDLIHSIYAEASEGELPESGDIPDMPDDNKSTITSGSEPTFNGDGNYTSDKTGWEWKDTSNDESSNQDNFNYPDGNDDDSNLEDDINDLYDPTGDLHADDDAYGENGNYQENTSGSESNNTNPSTLTDDQRVDVLAAMVSQLNTLMMQKYGNDITPLPPVLYDPNYLGTGFAMYLNGNIHVPPRFFNKLATDGDRLSTLYHEYTHYINNLKNTNPINKVNGIIPTVVTSYSCSQLYYNQAEHDYNYNSSLKGFGSVSWAKAYADHEDKKTYEYKCSNYYKDEIAAREAELQGEKDGLFVLSNSYRQDRLDGIKEYTWHMERALNFEKILPGYNSDGTPIKN